MPGSQKCSPNSDWNPQLKLLKVCCVSLEMSSDPKQYFGSTLDEFTELACVPFVRLQVTVSNRLNARQSFYGIDKLGKFVECKTRILFRIA